MSLSGDHLIAAAVWVVVLLLFAIRAGVNLERRRLRARLPYRWACPRCPFTTGGTDPGDVLTITAQHEREHRNDQRA